MPAPPLPSWLPWLAWIAAALALLPLLLAQRNLRRFEVPSGAPPDGTRLSILIPARDEAAHIATAVRRALASRGVEIEVVVLDDQSSDATAALVRELAGQDGRVRLATAPPLPEGWAGKQRACQLLAACARHKLLMFVDADVALEPDAAARAAALLLADPQRGLVSGFPRQRTGSLGEHLLIGWIHVLLLGYLPIERMRASLDPAYGAGCGQWMLARRAAYDEAGGHGACPASLHDGTSLPRSFRQAGWKTDVFDGDGLAAVRMYTGARETWAGLGKSAGEGLATPRGLPVWTLLIAGGHVLPWALLVAGLALGAPAVWLPAALGVAANLALRALLLRRFHQHPAGALLHPVGAALLLALNWQGLVRHLRGRPSQWRGRRYVRTGGTG